MSTMALACTSSRLKRFIKASIASCGVFEARIILTTSSILSLAMISPSKICALSCAFLRSYFVRLITTSWRCSTKHLIQSFSVNTFGRPCTKAMQLTAKLVCKAVILNNLLSTTLALASLFTSTTMRNPSRSLSSFTFEIPSILCSFTRSAILLMSSALLTP